MNIRHWLPVAAGLALLVAGCSPVDTPPGSTTASPRATLTVFAAASLTATFTDLGATFMTDHPDVDVAFSFAGSSDLLTQLQGGAAADVFASADTTTMTKAREAGLTEADPTAFATNTLTIVTPPGNPARIATFADLARVGVNTVICAPVVPCGSAAAKMQTLTAVSLTPVSEEQSVSGVLAKVESGEADAGLVYVTDAVRAGDRVATVTFDESAEVVNTYPIAILTDTAHADRAQSFIDLVTGAHGREVLLAAGFGPAS